MKPAIPGLAIRETCLADLNSIYRLGLNEPVFISMRRWNASQLAEIFSNSALISFTVVRKKEILGFITGKIIDQSATVEWIMVNEKFRRRGIGRFLLDKFLNTAKIKGVSFFIVASFPVNSETEYFFSKSGIADKKNFTGLSCKIYNESSE